MNSNHIILVVLGIVGAITFSTFLRKKKVPRKEFLERLAEHLKTTVESQSGSENYFRLSFSYRNQPFVYEDIEDAAFETKTYTGFLKTQSGTNFSFSFKERQSGSSGGQLNTWSDLVSFRWGKGQEVVNLPPSLKDFSVFTNDPHKARAVLSNERVVSVLNSFKSKDHRGTPVMALDIFEGLITLKFYPPEIGAPSWEDFQNNAKGITEYSERLFLIVQACKGVQENKV